MIKDDSNRDGSVLISDDILKGNDDDSWCNFLPCCHVKNDSVMDFWGLLTKGWQLRHHSKTNAAFVSVVNENRDNETTAPEETEGEDIPLTSPLVPPFAEEEQEKLRCILNGVADTVDEEKNDAPEHGGNSMLLRLATVAVKLAQDAPVTASQEQPTSYFDVHDDENAESVIQQFLKAAKRNETTKIAQLKHLERVQILVNSYALLIQPLELCVQAAMSSSCPMEKMTLLLGQCAPSETLTCLWDAVDLVGGEDKLYRLMKTCFHLAVAHAFLACRHHDATQQLGSIVFEASSDDDAHNGAAIRAMYLAFVDFLHKKTADSSSIDHHTLEREHFSEWYNRHVPGLVSALPLFMRALVFPSFGEEEKEMTSCLFPALDNDSGSANTLFSISSGPLSSWLFLISSSFPVAYRHKKVGSTWHRLYSSLSEGFNMSTLEHSLSGYNGPTLLLVQAYDKETQTNHTFGAFASQPWIKQDGPSFYGDDDSFLFHLEPKFQVLRAVASQSRNSKQQQHYNSPVPHYQYFYLDKSKRLATPTIINSKRTDNNVTKHESGIGLGGSKRRPRFFIAASLDQCHLGSRDATFEAADYDGDDSNVPFSNNNQSWDLHSLEVWGLGGDAALTSLERHRSMEDTQLQKARQVDKSAFLSDLRSGLIESKLFGFHEDIRNRDGGCLLDCHDERDEWTT